MESGKCKTPLVAWSFLTQQREKGGLGFKEYTTHVDALLNRWVARGIEEPNSEWTVTFLTLIQEFSWEQRRVQNRARYTNSDRLMLGTVNSF